MTDDDTAEQAPNVQYPLSDFTESVAELHDEGTTATTETVAERVGCSYELAYKRLTTLEGETIEHEEIGNAYIWEPIE